MLQSTSCGVVWCGVVWYGVVWCGVVWCGMVVHASCKTIDSMSVTFLSSSSFRQVIMANTVFEIAHCGVDVGNPKVFTCIVGSKGPDPLFYCHVFKCDTKEIVSSFGRSIHVRTAVRWIH